MPEISRHSPRTIPELVSSREAFSGIFVTVNGVSLGTFFVKLTAKALQQKDNSCGYNWQISKHTQARHQEEPSLPKESQQFKRNHSHVFCSSTGNKINQRFNVLNFSSPCFVVRPKETTEEGAIGGEKDPSTSQEEGKKYVIMYTCVFM